MDDDNDDISSSSSSNVVSVKLNFSDASWFMCFCFRSIVWCGSRQYLVELHRDNLMTFYGRCFCEQKRFCFCSSHCCAPVLLSFINIKAVEIIKIVRIRHLYWYVCAYDSRANADIAHITHTHTRARAHRP